MQTISIIDEFQVLYNYVILSINDAIHVYYIWREHCYFNLHILYFNIIHIGLFLELNHLMTWEEISCIYLSIVLLPVFQHLWQVAMIFMYTLCVPMTRSPCPRGWHYFMCMLLCNGHLLVVYIEYITCVICCLRKSEFLAVIFCSSIKLLNKIDLQNENWSVCNVVLNIKLLLVNLNRKLFSFYIPSFIDIQF